MPEVETGGGLRKVGQFGSSAGPVTPPTLCGWPSPLLKSHVTVSPVVIATSFGLHCVPWTALTVASVRGIAAAAPPMPPTITPTTARPTATRRLPTRRTKSSSCTISPCDSLNV